MPAACPELPGDATRARRSGLRKGPLWALATVAVTGAVAVTALSGAGAVTALSGAGAADDLSLVRARPSGPITWGACPALAAGATRDPRQVCGTVRVPLDYRDLGGRTITIEVSRIATARPGTRRGVLVVVPGGPGSRGLDLPGAVAAALPATVLDRYDVIGLDPRGVGHSTPVSCGFGGADLLQDLPYPAPGGSVTTNVAFARSAAVRCASSDSAGLLPFITTANEVRDLDRIRAALGEPRLSLFAASYGGYVGTAYSSLFADRTDRIVLDSSVDAGRVWYEQYRLLGQGLDARFPDGARYVADHNGTVGFGTTVAAVRARFLALTSRLDSTPVRVPGVPVPLDGNVLRRLTLDLLYEDAALSTLGQLWPAAAHLTAGSASSAEAALVKRLIAQKTAPAPVPGVPVDNWLSAKYAVICGDVSWPRDVARYAANVARDRVRWPLTAGMPANISPCAFWKTPPVEAPVRIDSRGPRNVLILQNRRDPATPLDSGLGVRGLLGSRAALITVDGGGHVVLQGGNRCATRLVIDFLTDGKMPGGDMSCPKS